MSGAVTAATRASGSGTMKSMKNSGNQISRRPRQPLKIRARPASTQICEPMEKIQMLCERPKA